MSKASLHSNTAMENCLAKPAIQFSVSAPGKVILFGEHSVVYGKLAVAASLGRRTVARISEVNGPRGTVILDLPQLDIHIALNCLLDKVEDLASDPDVVLLIPKKEFCWHQPEGLNLDQLRKFVITLMSYYGINYSSSEKEYAVLAFLKLFVGILLSVDTHAGLTNSGAIRVHMESDVPMRSGLGSSAAYGVSLSGALLHLIRCRYQQMGNGDSKNISREGFKPSGLPGLLYEELDLVSQWAFVSEVVMHGRPSGLDNTVCTFGSAVQFRKGHKPEQVVMPHGLKVLLVDTGVPRNTAQLVGNVAAKFRRFTTIVGAILEAMEFVALEAVAILSSMCTGESLQEFVYSKVELLGELVDMNQSLLMSLGVSHRRLDEAVQIASSAGFHAKLTGAGGGGYAFVLLPFTAEVNKIMDLKKQLVEHGFSCIETVLGGPGVTVNDGSNIL